MSTLKEYAIWYANIGWPVFPCRPRQKEPATAHGVKDATTDLAQIDKWWSKNPSYNIGLACGGKHGVYAIDVDVDDKINGLETLKQFPNPPKTLCQNTPRGGLHLLYQTDNPPINRNSAWPGIDIRGNGYYVLLAPSIHPNGKQYAWAPNCAPWQITPHEYPDFFRPATKHVLTPEPMALVAGTLVMSDRLRRASAYLSKIDAAVQGNCGHNKLLWAAQCMVFGFLLSDEEAFNILALEYNPRCEPPWNMSSGKDHKDFCRKINEARKNPPRHPKGWLLAASMENDHEEASPRLKASIKSLLATVQVKKSACGISSSAVVKGIKYAFSKPTRDEFEFIINPFGFLGRFCSWINGNSIRSQPILTLGGTLAFFGALFGRKIKDELDARTNIYCMGIGRSSAGKQHAQSCIRKLVRKVGCKQLLGACDFASDISIEKTVYRKQSVVFLLDEIGHILMHLKSKPTACTEKIISTLMRIWSSASDSYIPKAYADDDNEVEVIQPCLSIYGTSTPARFIEGLSTAELDDGWLSRCLVFHTDTFPFKSRVYKDRIPPGDICDFVSAWANRVIEPEDKTTIAAWQNHTGDKCEVADPLQVEIKTTDEAEEMLRNFDLISRSIGEESPTLACLWAKAEENARKFALIIASSTNYDNPSIDAASANYGCRLASYLLRDFGYNMVGQLSSNPHEEKKNKIWALIKKKKASGLSRGSLARLSEWSSKKERVELLEDLRESGRIVTKSIDGIETHWVSEFYPG